MWRSKLIRLALSAALISCEDDGGSVGFVARGRGMKRAGPRTGEVAALAEGEDGGLTVAASDCATLMTLETEDTDWWRAVGLLERNP